MTLDFFCFEVIWGCLLLSLGFLSHEVLEAQVVFRGGGGNVLLLSNQIGESHDSDSCLIST
jgi:hypothetical protein